MNLFFAQADMHEVMKPITEKSQHKFAKFAIINKHLKRFTSF